MKVDVKYRKLENGFDFKLSFNPNLNIFKNTNFSNKENLNHIIKVGFVGVLAYLLNVIS